MDTLTFSLPSALKAWVDDRAGDDHDGDASAYLQELIASDRERAEKIAAMQRLIDEGLASGISTRTKEEMREDAYRRAGLSAQL